MIGYIEFAKMGEGGGSPNFLRILWSCVRSLLENKKADVNAVDGGHVEVVKVLLEHNADVNGLTVTGAGPTCRRSMSTILVML
jgi:Fe-S cluster biogenesis protein NfuA